MPYEKIIKAIKSLYTFEQERFDMLSKDLKLVKLKKNEIWEKEGTINSKMGFVNKGILRQFYLKDGNEFTELFYAEEEFIGHYISYQKGEPAPTNIQALEDCEILEMPFEKLVALQQKDPHFEEFSQIIGAQKLFELQERAASFLVDTPEERYYKLLKDKSDLHDRIPQYHIAQYLGIRPESLSRIRKRHFS